MITREMSILEVLRQYPEARAVFERHGMPCIGCMGAMEESLENGARMHGLDLEKLLQELKELDRT